MAFDFPNAPSVGTVYAPVGGPTYVWDGQKWAMTTQALVQTLTPTADAYNRIVNPAMQHSQENSNTAGSAANYYVADQWYPSFATTGAISVQRIQTPTPNGSQNRFMLQVTTADTSLTTSENAEIQTKIEGIRVADFKWGTASARQVILRFGWRSPAGTYSFRLVNGAANRTYIGNFTISGAQINADTEQVFTIPGDTTGTWATDTGIGIYLSVVIAGGPSQLGVAGWQAGILMVTSANSNGLATVGATYHLFDVGLYLDPNNTGKAPPWVVPDFASELAACQRYWVKVVANVRAMAPSNGGFFENTVMCPVTMRAVPSATIIAGNRANANQVNCYPQTPDGGRFSITANAASLDTYALDERVIMNARL